jgi:hypothetical protein
MGCGASTNVSDRARNISVSSSPIKHTNVESFCESEAESNQVNEIPIDSPKETPIDWEWKSSGIKKDRNIEGDSKKFKDEEERLQQIRANNMNARAAGEHLEPIIELEDFEEGDFQGPSKVKGTTSVEADEASSCATPRA